MCVCLTRGALAVQFCAQGHTSFERCSTQQLFQTFKRFCKRCNRYAMDFTLTANANGPSDPNNIVLRGADPLYSLPVAHPLRRAGFNLQSTPGGLNASLDNALSSEIEAALVPALRPDAALRSSGFILRPPTPQKLQAVLLQLGAEPPPHRLNLSASYPSLSAFASAVALTHESSAAHYKIATAVIWSYCVLVTALSCTIYTCSRMAHAV